MPRSTRPLSHAVAAGLAAAVWLAPAEAQPRLERDAFHYIGAFRLPDAGERPKTFAWGGDAMTFRPAEGRRAEPGDLPGSLYVMGHDRMAWGELPDGNQVAEIAIPDPLIAGRLADLPVARFLQPFADVAAGRFPGLDELPQAGMAYLDAPESGPRVHLTWGQHIQPEQEQPTHAFVSPDLSRPDFQGSWFIGERTMYSVNGYMFPIPADWAAAHTGDRRLATGRYKDGGWSGMGPSLFAYSPWIAGDPAPPGTRLDEVVLLQYATSRETDRIERAMDGYQHPDEWEGGAWIETADGRAAVLFAGTKSVGTKYWYGFVNPAGPEETCVAGEFVGDFTVCRMADGTPCPESDLTECAGHNGYRGWWTTRWEAQLILYDPADLAAVAAGETEPWTPQPYAVIPIDDHLFLNPAGIEEETLGTGPQRRYRIGPATYDPDGQRLFVLELFADDAKPVVHVWRIE